MLRFSRAEGLRTQMDSEKPVDSCATKRVSPLRYASVDMPKRFIDAEATALKM